MASWAAAVKKRIRERGVVHGFTDACSRAVGKAAFHALGPMRRPFSGSPVERDQVRTVLVVKLYGIGNMIMLTPALRTLRRDLPSARIILLTDGRAVKVVSECNYFDEIITLPSAPADLGTNEVRPIFLMALRRLRPDLIITSFPLGVPRISDYYDLIGARWSVGHDVDGPPEKFSHRLAYDPSRHEVICNLELLEAAGLKDPIREVRIEVGEGHAREAASFLAAQPVPGPWYAFHCGSYGNMAAKRWPAGHFAELGDRLVRDFGGRAVLLGGKDEKDLCSSIASLMESRPAIAAGELSLLGTAALLRECRLMVSNDSGLMHLAAAMGTPLAAVFGPTSPLKNSPWTDPRKYLLVQSGEPCAPCFQVGQPILCDDPRCMSRISVEDVYAAAREMLNRPGPFNPGTGP